VYRLSELLSEQRAATRDNVQRKQARTDGERDEDDDAMAEPASDDSDVEDDNDVPYNPKNLPLGWDGKVENVKRSCQLWLKFETAVKRMFRDILLFSCRDFQVSRTIWHIRLLVI